MTTAWDDAAAFAGVIVTIVATAMVATATGSTATVVADGVSGDIAFTGMASVSAATSTDAVALHIWLMVLQPLFSYCHGHCYCWWQLLLQLEY